MPGTNGTGPRGLGPITGRGTGRCAISVTDPAEEICFLKNRVSVLKDELMQVRRRIRNAEALETQRAERIDRCPPG